MKISPISKINFINQKPIQKQTFAPNFEIKDVVSFYGREKTYGISYEDALPNIDIRRQKTVPELRKDFQSGIDITEDRNKLILSRFQYADKDAQKFIKKHPKFNLEDIRQDLLLVVMHATDAELRGKGEYRTFTRRYNIGRDEYFKKLLKNPQEKRIDEEIENQAPLEEIADNIALRCEMEKIFETMRLREAETIRLRHGLEDGDSYTLEEIGEKFGCKRSRVHVVHTNAMKKMCKPHHLKNLKDFY